MRAYVLGLIVLLGSALPVQAQVVAPTIVQFASPDHAAIIPANQVGAGQPTITSYQGLLLLASADAVTGPVIVTGSIVSKAAATLSGVQASPLQLSFAQLGITIPACTTAPPCPQYSLVLTAIGPGGSSLRGVGSESQSFTAAVPSPAALPAAPTNVLVK